MHCVDASAVSLEFAASTNTYDDLERGDFATNIRNASPRRGFGRGVDAVPRRDLGDLLHAMAQALRPDGLAVFNADVLDDDVSMFAWDSVEGRVGVRALAAASSGDASEGQGPVVRCAGVELACGIAQAVRQVQECSGSTRRPSWTRRCSRSEAGAQRLWGQHSDEMAV